MSLVNKSGFGVMPIGPVAEPMDPNIDTEKGLLATSATQQHALGRRHETWDGRKYRYIKNGATQLEAALLVQSEAVAAEAIYEIQTGYTTAVGDTIITALVTTASGIADGDLVDGVLVVNKGDGIGNTYRIANNKWLTGDTVMQIELYDPIRVATAATSEFTFVKNIYSGGIVAPTTLTGTLLGIPNGVIEANYYGWIQTKGLCPATVDTGETLVVGEVVGYPAAIAVAGAVGVTAVTDVTVGRVVTIAAAAETALIDLMLE